MVPKVTMFLILKFLVLGLFLFTNYTTVEGVRRSTSKSKEDDAEIEAKLKLLNKPPIKTFHTEWGDIVDCIDMHKQPAFDHPLLKDHKIMLSSSVEEMEHPTRENSGESEPNEKPSEILSDLQCPEGTVPIRRTTKADLLNKAKPLPFSDLSKAKSPSASSNAAFNDQHGAVVNLVNPGQRFYGASAKINVYNPMVKPGQFSAAQMWIMKGEMLTPKNDVIQAGWIVSPDVNGDTRTRVFGYWTGDGFNKTGCWNTDCPGFVQVHKRIHINAPLAHISVFGGQQYVMDLEINQGRKTGAWWLKLGGQDIGYWPKELFADFGDGAEFLSWGGHVRAGDDNISPPMGSGHIPDTCYMRKLMYVNGFAKLVDLTSDLPVETLINCALYSITNRGYISPEVGFEFYFGGPGGKCIP